MRMKFPLKWVVLLLIVLGLAWGITRALKARSTQQQAAAVAAEALKMPVTFALKSTDVLVAERLSINQVEPVSGTVRAVNAVTLRSTMGAVVTRINALEGATVKAGQVLAQLDADDTRARLQQAQQQSNAAKAQVELAKRQRDNNRALVEKGFISSTALVSSDSNYATALANYEAALAAQQIAKRGLEDAALRAPFSGVVTQRHVKAGERVAVNAPVVDIVDVSQLEVEVLLPIAASSGLKTGQTATLNLESQPQPITAKVARINPSIDAGSRSVRIYLNIPTGKARVGEFATGELTVGTLEGTAVPLDSIRTDQPSPYVQVVRDQTIAHTTVQILATGRAGENRYAIVEPLPAGTTVLSPTAGLIANGTAVTLP
ncbi:MAG: efflux RND transporter periplasmic adaptor subunit [Burkholderiaceae bacterium]|nr:efflux RND transporter periplasmic adaptor subunit [Burkholderiaceae bacterium]